MQTLSLVPSLLPSLCLRVELLLLGAGLEVHSEVIELFATLQVLRILFVLFKEIVGAIVSVDKVLPVLFLKLRILVLDGATKVPFVLFALVDAYVVIVDVDEWSLLVSREKMVLFLVVGPLKGFH